MFNSHSCHGPMGTQRGFGTGVVCSTLPGWAQCKSSSAVCNIYHLQQVAQIALRVAIQLGKHRETQVADFMTQVCKSCIPICSNSIIQNSVLWLHLTARQREEMWAHEEETRVQRCSSKFLPCLEKSLFACLPYHSALLLSSTVSH